VGIILVLLECWRGKRVELLLGGGLLRSNYGTRTHIILFFSGRWRVLANVGWMVASYGLINWLAHGLHFPIVFFTNRFVGLLS